MSKIEEKKNIARTICSVVTGGYFLGYSSKKDGEDIYDHLERVDVDVDSLPAHQDSVELEADRNLDDYSVVEQIIQNAMPECAGELDDMDHGYPVMRLQVGNVDDEGDKEQFASFYENQIESPRDGGVSEKMELLTRCYEDALMAGFTTYAKIIDRTMRRLAGDGDRDDPGVNLTPWLPGHYDDPFTQYE